MEVKTGGRRRVLMDPLMDTQRVSIPRIREGHATCTCGFSRVKEVRCHPEDKLTTPDSGLRTLVRIYMQIPPEGDHAPRFYHLHLQEDLLEGWTLIREWGYQGAGGRVLREHFAAREEAEAALIRVRDEQLKRGYIVVFMQGQT